MLVMPFLPTNQIKKGSNTAVMKNNHYANQNRIKGAHKDKMNRVISPLKSKWKHHDTFLIMDSVPFPD
jgi:hypothetical protein